MIWTWCITLAIPIVYIWNNKYTNTTAVVSRVSDVRAPRISNVSSTALTSAPLLSQTRYDRIPKRLGIGVKRLCHRPFSLIVCTLLDCPCTTPLLLLLYAIRLSSICLAPNMLSYKTRRASSTEAWPLAFIGIPRFVCPAFSFEAHDSSWRENIYLESRQQTSHSPAVSSNNVSCHKLHVRPLMWGFCSGVGCWLCLVFGVRGSIWRCTTVQCDPLFNCPHVMRAS